LREREKGEESMTIYYNSIDYTIPSKVSTENSCETTKKQHDVLLANLDATFDSYQLHIYVHIRI